MSHRMTIKRMATPKLVPRPPIIWVLGAPGSGKSTQCVKIMEKYNFHYLSADYLIVEEIRSGSHKGREFEDMIKAGKSVSDKAVMCLFKKAFFLKTGATCGFIIDGFPTNKMQAKTFERFLTPADMIIYLGCEDDVAIERCRQRAAATADSADDDGFDEEALMKRLSTFRGNIDGILIGREPRVLLIIAERSEDEVFEDVCAGIDCLLKKRAERLPEVCTDMGPEWDCGKREPLPPRRVCCKEDDPPN